MQIEILKVEVENKGKYKNAVVSYKQDGKVQSRNVVSFGDYKHVYDKMVDATQGDLFDIKLEKVLGKDNVERWQWTEATVQGKAGVGTNKSPPGGAVTSPRSSYETPEERARKQVYIVRQSSITAALTLAALRKTAPTPASVIAEAKIFEDFVLNLSDHYGKGDDYQVEVM